MSETVLRCLRRRAGERLYSIEGDWSASVAALPSALLSERARDTSAAAAVSGRGPTRILDLPARKARVHLRRLHHGGLLAPITRDRFLGWRRPLDELRVGEALRRAGAPVPRPLLAHGERHGIFWCLQVGTAHIEDAVDGLRWLAREPSRPERIAAAASAGQAIRRFHEAGGRHADLNAGNLLLRSSARGFEVWVIDLDRARIGGAPSPARRAREILRLYRSLRKRGMHESLGPREEAAFLGAYCRGDRLLRRSLRRHLRRQRFSLALHAVGYAS